MSGHNLKKKKKSVYICIHTCIYYIKALKRIKKSIFGQLFGILFVSQSRCLPLFLFGGFLRQHKRVRCTKKQQTKCWTLRTITDIFAKNDKFHSLVQIPPLPLFSFTLSGVIIPLNTYLASAMVCEFLWQVNCFRLGGGNT